MVNEQGYSNVSRTNNLTGNNGTNSVSFYNSTNTPADGTSSALPSCWRLGSLAGNISGDSFVTPTATGTYISRYMKFFINSSLDLIHKTYYVLNAGSGIYHTVYITGLTGNPLSGAEMKVSKQIGGSYTTISTQESDNSGAVLNYLDVSVTYRFTITKSGYTTVTFTNTPNPVNPIIYAKLSGGSGSGTDYVNYSSIFSNLTFKFLPSTYHQNVTFNATFEIVDPDSKITFQKFNVSYSNGTLLCNVTSTTELGGTMEVCSIPFVVGTYCVQGHIARTGFNNYSFSPLCYIVYNSTVGLGSLDIGSAISDTSYFVVALLVAIILCAFLSTFGGGLVVAFGAVGTFAFFAALKPNAMIGVGLLAIPFWAVVALMGMSVAALMVLRSYI